jgi:hypothetical protein
MKLLITHFPTAYSYFQRGTTFYGKRLLAQYPILRLEEHPLSVVHYCLFSVFTASSVSRDISPSCGPYFQNLMRYFGLLAGITLFSFRGKCFLAPY